MTTLNQTAVGTKSSAFAQILFVTLIGAGLLFAAGHAQSSVLHDSAHDVRHASGFPCH